MRSSKVWFVLLPAASVIACGLSAGDLADDLTGASPSNVSLAAACDPIPTTWIELSGNLSPDDALSSWDPTNPDSGSNVLAKGPPAYSAEGDEVAITFYFTHNEQQLWQWHVLRNCDAVELGNGELLFDLDGALVEVREARPLCIAVADGSCSTNIALKLGSPKDATHEGYDGITGRAGPSSASFVYRQDGHGPGSGPACR